MKTSQWTILLLAGAALALGCRREAYEIRPSETDISPDPDDPVPIEPAHCNGMCIATAPATYTGPSFFWLGLPSVVPPCPPETPYEGIEGLVDGTKIEVLAKECRITLSDLCADEGLACAPIPNEDLHLCIHHDGSAPCPPDYPERTTLSEVESHLPLTLCCIKPLLPG